MFFQEEVIVNNGYGGATIIEETPFGTEVIQERPMGYAQPMYAQPMYAQPMMMPREEVIVEQRGLFGPRREEVIMNNGMGGTTIVEERRGLFGGRREEIIHTGPFGNTEVIEERRRFF